MKSHAGLGTSPSPRSSPPEASDMIFAAPSSSAAGGEGIAIFRSALTWPQAHFWSLSTQRQEAQAACDVAVACYPPPLPVPASFTKLKPSLGLVTRN